MWTHVCRVVCVPVVYGCEDGYDILQISTLKYAYNHSKSMTTAFVLINCDLGAEAGIIEKLNELDQVKDVFEIMGTHDIMVRLDAENFEKVREIVSWNIQKLDKIRSTSTLIRKEV